MHHQAKIQILIQSLAKIVMAGNMTSGSGTGTLGGSNLPASDSTTDGGSSLGGKGLGINILKLVGFTSASDIARMAADIGVYLVCFAIVGGIMIYCAYQRGKRARRGSASKARVWLQEGNEDDQISPDPEEIPVQIDSSDEPDLEKVVGEGVFKDAVEKRKSQHWISVNNTSEGRATKWKEGNSMTWSIDAHMLFSNNLAVIFIFRFLSFPTLEILKLFRYHNYIFDHKEYENQWTRLR